MGEPTTLPGYLFRNAAAYPDHPAIREKNLGIWQSYGWRDYRDEVSDFALGLAALGFARGDKLSVIGDNRPRLYWAQLAAVTLGGVSVPVYQDAIGRELTYVLDHAEVAVIVAEDQEQVDKIRAIKDQLPALRLVVYDDPRGVTGYQHAWLKSFAEVQRAGRAFGAVHPSFLDHERAEGQASDIAFICYTSGTTGHPKGVMLTHHNAIVTARRFIEAEDVRRSDNWLSYLPMAWAGDTIYGLVLSLVLGATSNCPESPETVRRDLRELGPSGILAPPRIWESMLSSIQVKAADATPLKRWVFERFRQAAEAAETLRAEGKAVPLARRAACALGEVLVYGPVRDQLGLRRARWAYTGGAPLGPDTFRFFRSFGVNLKQVYGSTEVSGLVSLQPDAEANPDTVGPICPGIEVRISDHGEVLVRSEGVFAGYFKDPAATREAVDGDGWFRTGDAGLIDGRGHLVIIDRAKDVGKLTDGTPFAPQFLENKLKYSPYIREAVAFGNEQPFAAAMIAIDLETVGNWAERSGLPYTSYMDLSRKAEVRALIRDQIVKCNETLPEPSRIRRFLLLGKDLDADDDEITRTRKVRRRHIADKYRPVIEALYGGAHEAELGITVTLEDGRRTDLRTRLVIEDVVAEVHANV